MGALRAANQAGGVCRASELKEELARLSLPTNGSRQQLEDRLMEHYQTAMQQDAQYEALSQQVQLPTHFTQLLVHSFTNPPKCSSRCSCHCSSWTHHLLVMHSIHWSQRNRNLGLTVV